MKGVYNLRPSEPKYCKTWDVSNVLGYLRKLSPIKYISLKDLTLKLVTLIAIITASRVQSLHLLTLNGLEKNCQNLANVFALDHPATFKTLSTETIVALALDTAADRTL
jgi:hypothetical protein